MNSVEENKNNQFKYLTDIVKDSKWSIKRGPFGSALKKQFFVPFGYKVYEQKHAIRNDFDIGNYYVNEEKFNELKAFELNPRDIIISCSGTVGRIAVAPDNLKKGIINQALLKISLNEKKVSITYFTYWFTDFVNEGSLKSKGAAIKNIISVKELKKIPIPIPSLEEQKRIVAKIDTLFAKIDKAISLTEESLKQAKNLLPSVLKEMFEKGKADGWEEKKLQDICEKITDGSHNPPKSCEGSKLMMLSGRNIRDNKLDFEKVRFVSEKDFIKEDKRTNIQAGDVLLTIVGSIGRSFVFPKGSPKVIFQRSVAVIKPHSILNPHFLSYFFKSPKSQEKLNTQARGAAQKGVYLKDIRGLQLLLPNIETQNEKVLFLDKNNLKAKQTQSKLEEQLAYLKQLKSSILSKAFKGEL
jgi:type I restriction enzyme, S subunit